MAYGSYLSSYSTVELRQMFWQSHMVKGGVCCLTDDPEVHAAQPLQGRLKTLTSSCRFSFLWY